METPKNKKERNGICAVFLRIWNAIFNSGGQIKGCARPGKTAQDHRDEALKKCPWLE
ncbi:MAG: hypothetical protein ACYTET_04835 [Planctomycetota bacterium]|jgi:hypothetical protein